MPFLKSIRFDWKKTRDWKAFPFNIPAFRGLKQIDLGSDVTFLVGENGSGKSTLLEAIASKCGFTSMGGGRNTLLPTNLDEPTLEDIITLSWLPKVANGFFLRAETFFDFASYIDQLEKEDPGRALAPYGGKSLHQQSHGEAFLSLFLNRFNYKGIYLLDEPEAALSPQRQLAFLGIINQLVASGKAQFIIATHSPILLAYPEAVIYNLDQAPMGTIDYEDTDHYFITRQFLNDRESFLRKIFYDD